MRYRELLEACWKGYHKEGMKTMFGKRYPNCVKNKKTNEGVVQEYDCSPMSNQDLEEDLRKWFREKWVRFGPDGKIRGACARGSSSEGKPKCLPAAKAHALGKKGRASSAAKKRREDPNPERRGAARNVATKTRSMKEQGIPELQPTTTQQQEPSGLRKGLDALGKVFTAGKLLQDPRALADQEIKNYLDPSRQNSSIIRRMFPGDKDQ